MAPAFTLRRPTVDELPAVAAIHRAAIPGTLNTTLGERHLVATYQATLTHDPSAFTIAVDETGVLGFLVTTMNVSALSSHIVGHMRWPQRVGMLRVATKPSLWLAAAQGLWTGRPIALDGVRVEPTLVAIATAPGSRKSGVGRALVAACQTFVTQQGGHAVRLDTRRANTGARAFYGRLGFTEVARRGLDCVLVKTW